MKKQTLILIGTLVGIALVGGIIYAQQTKTIKIGLIDVLTGPNAALGENFQKGVQLALAQYQKGHPRQNIQLFVEDDMDSPTTTMMVYHKLVDQDNVDALIVATTQSINVIYDEASKLSIPIISYGSENNPEQKDNIFHVFPSPLPVDLALGLFIHALSPPGEAASSTVGVYTDDSVITQLYSEFKDGYGANISDFNLDLNMTSNDMHTVAAQVLADNPKYIFMTNYASLGAQFIQELKNLSGGKIQQTFVFDLTLNQVLDQYQKSLGDLSFLDGSYVVSLKNADPSAFLAQYKAQYGSEAGPLSDYGYDAMNVLLSSHDSSSSMWLSNIQNLKLTGATGDIGFDPLGRRIPTFSVSQMQGGKIPDYK